MLNTLIKKIIPIEKETSTVTVAEIHETFYTEVDRLLQEAGIKQSTETDKKDLINKATRLNNLGFGNAKDTIEGKQEINRISIVEQQNKEKKELEETIRYFSFKYPHYKFITEESIKKICEKYNLVYATVDRYIGDVPDKNLKQIEEFSIKEEDICYMYERRFWAVDRNLSTSYGSKEQMEKLSGNFNRSSDFLEIVSRCPLEIAAPLSDFNLRDHEVKDFKLSKIEIPDPVVFQPVVRNGKKYFLIVTAWGDEASDELVVNHKNN